MSALASCWSLSRSWCNGVRGLLLAIAGFLCSAAWALDPDVAFHIQSRKAAVSGQCPATEAQSPSTPAPTVYVRALCLLFGMGVPEQIGAALELLRQASDQGDTEAQLALADTLQQGGPGAQEEALRWYARAADAWDVRARVRQARLSQRLQAAVRAATTVSPASSGGSLVVDAATDLADLPMGYHCHPFAFGKKVCHAGPQ